MVLSAIAEDFLQCHEGMGGNRVFENECGQHACIRGPPGESEAENMVCGTKAVNAGGLGFKIAATDPPFNSTRILRFIEIILGAITVLML